MKFCKKKCLFVEYDCIRITDFLKNEAETDCPLENQVKRLQFLLFMLY